MIKLEWQDNKRRILHYTFPEHWQWDDFYAVKERADAWLDDISEHDDGVMLLLDIRHSQLDSVMVDMLIHAKHLCRGAHPRADTIVVITEERGVHNIIPLVRRLVPRFNQDNLFAVKTMSEAQAIVQRRLAVEV